MNLKGIFIEHLPSILTGVAVVGVIETTVLAVKATPKAIDILEQMEEKPTKKEEVIKATWKCYIPSVIACSATIVCILGANRNDSCLFASWR